MLIMPTRKTSPAWFGIVVAVTGKGGGQQRVAKKGFKKGTYRAWSGEQTRTRHLRAKMVRTVPYRYRYLSGTIPYRTTAYRYRYLYRYRYYRYYLVLLVLPVLLGTTGTVLVLYRYLLLQYCTASSRRRYKMVVATP